ncbi:hypothetical protein [Algoriphagus sp. oki45]|uniref:hypothetical protein n=1 Tax=Algoriphagus sp. oki45 TaxID=3067294 RepID=UPI0030C728C6
MKKLILAGIALGLIFVASGSQTNEIQAGPFLKQGHWVSLSNGGAECMTHWWNNDCKVGDTRPPGNQ